MTRFTLAWIAAVLFVASILSVLGYSLPQSSRAQQADLVSCRVLVIYDGDTFGCDLDGSGRIEHSDEHIRMLGIDTPEMHYSRKNTTGKDEPFAREARNLLETTILHKSVYLVFDQERYDTHNRTLAYVYLDSQGEQMLNARLLEEGLATVLFMGVNRRHEDGFRQIERRARQQHRNRWQVRQSS